GEGLTITNVDGQFEYVNPAYAKMVGYSPEQLLGHTPDMVTFSNDLKKSDEAWELRRKGKASSYEVRLQTKDRSEVQALITSVPRLKDGQFSGSIAVITNISERAKLEQMKSDFINRASHELRTPLTTAILMADLLEDAAEQEREKFTGILKQELNRQRLLLEDLLIAGRIETRGVEIHCVWTEIQPIIDEAIACVTPQADLRQVRINKQIVEILPVIHTDRTAVLQILINLLTNAVKFSRRNSLILISANLVEASVMITVKDFGIGIPAQDRPHIMSRFFRAQNATTLEIPGTGIGLYIIKEILDALGGRIEIDSMENQGTTVTIFLPINDMGNTQDSTAH
ncbi:MAG TPA: PAS domain-containing sensor histidine kinase, partial [Anaerolineales bacterium]|nr:PAS domain-containing sensor histidine kinase [Anaerolineales bacterium]